MTFIAEVKTESPFGFRSVLSWDELFEVAATHGDWVSVHTDPRWGGSFDLLSRARAATGKPILAKGIHRTDDEVRRALDLGADFVLVVGRIPDADPSRVLAEARDLRDLRDLPEHVRAVWNSRDLSTGRMRGSFEEARRIRPGWLCQASGISSPGDVSPRADAFIVGENLVRFCSGLRRFRELPA